MYDRTHPASLALHVLLLSPLNLAAALTDSLIYVYVIGLGLEYRLWRAEDGEPVARAVTLTPPEWIGKVGSKTLYIQPGSP